LADGKIPDILWEKGYIKVTLNKKLNFAEKNIQIKIFRIEKE